MPASASPTQQIRNGSVHLSAWFRGHEHPYRLGSRKDDLAGCLRRHHIPYQFDGYEHAHKTLDVTGCEWPTRQLATAGLAWIANPQSGFCALSSRRRAVNSSADVSGLRRRFPPEFVVKPAFDALGASTQTIAFQVVSLALANKAGDGQDNPIGTIVAARFFEMRTSWLASHRYRSPSSRRTASRCSACWRSCP